MGFQNESLLQPSLTVINSFCFFMRFNFELMPMSTQWSVVGGKNIKGLGICPATKQSTAVFQEGPPVRWLFLPGRLFVGWSALIGKTFGWPISSSIVTAASDKARPASRKPEIYPPAFHHSFTISAQGETERTRGSRRGITGTRINKNHMGSIQIVKRVPVHVCICVRAQACKDSLTSSLWHTHTLKYWVTNKTINWQSLGKCMLTSAIFLD